MTFVEILLIAVALAMDAFAVSLAMVASGRSTGPRAAFRLSFHFGLFQFLMPVAGWALGRSIVSYISAFDHWVAFGLLLFVGGRMVYSGAGPRDEEKPPGDPSRGLSLVILSLAVSIDALAVGLTFAMLEVSIWYPSLVVGVTASLISLVGIHLGNRLSERFGQRMEIIGGIVLILIGLRILMTH